MSYHQITSGERYSIAALRTQGFNQAEIARALGRHRSTISRELRRNSSRFDGAYRPSKAIERTSGRRSRSRRNHRFSKADFKQVEALLRQDWSPEQISGYLGLYGPLSISHETIYRYVWQDWHLGGTLHMHLRGARKKRRKRYGAYDSRGRLAGKRHISQRPVAAEQRSEIGHWLEPKSRPTGERSASSVDMPTSSNPSPQITGPSSTTTSMSSKPLACASSSPRLIIHGSVAPTRTRTA
jgi:IS30 family transposase